MTLGELRAAFLPGWKECQGGHTKSTVADLVEFLVSLPQKTPLGVWCHQEDGSENLMGIEIGLKGFEYRVYEDMKPGQYGRAHLLVNITSNVIVEDDDLPAIAGGFRMIPDTTRDSGQARQSDTWGDDPDNVGY